MADTACLLANDGVAAFSLIGGAAGERALAGLLAALLIHATAICRKKTRVVIPLDGRALTHCLPRKNSRGVANLAEAAGGQRVNRRETKNPTIPSSLAGFACSPLARRERHPFRFQPYGSLAVSSRDALG